MTLSEVDRRCWSTAPLVITVGVLYFACAELGHFLSFRGTLMATIWPAAGLMVGILSRLPLRRWPPVLIAAAIAGVVSGVLVHGARLPIALAFAAANALEHCFAGWLLQRFIGSPFSLKRSLDIGGLIAFGVILAPVLGATVGAAVLFVQQPEERFADLWYIWWISDAAGMAMLAPLVILFSTREDGPRLRRGRICEAALLAISLVAVSGFVFGVWPDKSVAPIRFPMFVFPPLGLATLRFGRRGAALAALCVALFAAWGTTRDLGWYAFIGQPMNTRVAALNVFIVIVTFTPLTISTIVDMHRQADRRFRAVMAHSPTVVFETDASGNCIFVNERWTHLTGLPPEDAHGFKWVSVVHPDDRERVIKAWLNANARGDESPVIECRYFNTAGEVHWVIANGVAVRDLDGRFIGYMGTILDITDRRAAELQLQQAYAELERRVTERTAELTEANRQLRYEIAERSRTEDQLQQQQSQLTHVSRLSTMGQMTAGLAHEVNQPLYAISNYARGMLRRWETREQPSAEELEAMENIAREAERAGEILRRVRTFVRKQEPGRVRFSLNDLVQDVIRLTAFDARQRQVGIETTFTPHDPSVTCDPIQIQQVVVNLIRNGFEAMEGLPPQARSLTIETFVVDGEVGCAVSDAGMGVPPEDSERIFEPFFTTKPQGLGMGLPISRTLVESFAGRLWVESRAAGGASFRFTLPHDSAEDSTA